MQSKPAAIFIEESIIKYKQELCIITLGPMTNIALAFHLSLANSYFNDVSSVRINGGSYTGVGNVVGNPSAEGNLFFDPEAAHIVISVAIGLCRISKMCMSIPSKGLWRLTLLKRYH